jgi:hypothetical protein
MKGVSYQIVHQLGRQRLHMGKSQRTEPDQKYEQTEYPKIFDSAAVVRLHDIFPLSWHSEKSEYTDGWHTHDTNDRLDVGMYLSEHLFVS